MNTSILGGEAPPQNDESEQERHGGVDGIDGQPTEEYGRGSRADQGAENEGQGGRGNDALALSQRGAEGADHGGRKHRLSNPKRQVIDDPNEALKAEIERAKQLENTFASSEVDGRYAVAEVAMRVRKDAKLFGGKSSFKTLAAALGKEHTSLFRAARVTKCWSLPRLRELTNTPRAGGVGLSWSHVEVIAELKKPEERDHALELALKDCTSVRELKTVVKELKAKASGARRGKPGAVGKVVTARSITALATKVRALHEKLESTDIVPPTADARETAEEVWKARAALENAVVEMSDFAITLHRKLEDARNAAVAPSHPRTPAPEPETLERPNAPHKAHPKKGAAAKKRSA